MLAAIDWNEVLMKATMGGIAGAVIGGIAGALGYLPRKSDEKDPFKPTKSPGKELIGVLVFLAVAVCVVGVFSMFRGSGDRGEPIPLSEERKPSAAVVDFGRYRDNSPLRLASEGKGASGVNVVSERDLVLLEQTDQIPCRIGETWGVRVRVSDIPAGGSVKLRTEIQHPPILYPDKSYRKKSGSEEELRPGMPEVRFKGWDFLKEYEAELKAGEWTIVVFLNDVEVARKVFTVVVRK